MLEVTSFCAYFAGSKLNCRNKSEFSHACAEHVKELELNIQSLFMMFYSQTTLLSSPPHDSFSPEIEAGKF